MANLSELIDGIEATLAGAASVDVSQSYDELTESILETPLIQVYPASCPPVSKGSATQKYTLGGSVRREYIIHADLFVCHRHYLPQDMRDFVNYVEEIDAILVGETDCNIFGVSGLGTFKWSWERAQFIYGGQKYLGAKYIFEVEVDV